MVILVVICVAINSELPESVIDGQHARQNLLERLPTAGTLSGRGCPPCVTALQTSSSQQNVLQHAIVLKTLEVVGVSEEDSVDEDLWQHQIFVVAGLELALDHELRDRLVLDLTSAGLSCIAVKVDDLVMNTLDLQQISRSLPRVELCSFRPQRGKQHDNLRQILCIRRHPHSFAAVHSGSRGQGLVVSECGAKQR